MTDYAKEFLEFIDEYHSQKEVYDDELDILLMEQEIEIRKNPINQFPPKDLPYFSPSSANSCDRELYMKVKGAKRDIQEKQPHTSRWTGMGTAFGDFIQKHIVFAEKHFKKLTGKEPSFIPARTKENYPFWERFAKEKKLVKHNGYEFYLFGTLDGKLLHKDGGTVGLEIKTKQTTNAATGHFLMKEPNEDHTKQIACYSIMYDIEDYIVFYGNLSKKAWNMNKETYEQNPDIRAFNVKIEDSDRQAILDKFATILECVENETPPKLDPLKWTFNNYKTACALDLSEEEFKEIEKQAKRAAGSSLPKYLKDQYIRTFEQIKEIRDND